MFDALSLEEVFIIAASARARLDGGEALAAFETAAGPEAAAWAHAWSEAWWKARQEEARGVLVIDAAALLEAMPESLKAWAAQRLAAPVYHDVDEAREAFMVNAELLRQQRERS